MATIACLSAGVYILTPRLRGVSEPDVSLSPILRHRKSWSAAVQHRIIATACLIPFGFAAVTMALGITTTAIVYTITFFASALCAVVGFDTYKARRRIAFHAAMLLCSSSGMTCIAAGLPILPPPNNSGLQAQMGSAGSVVLITIIALCNILLSAELHDPTAPIGSKEAEQGVHAMAAVCIACYTAVMIVSLILRGRDVEVYHWRRESAEQNSGEDAMGSIVLWMSDSTAVMILLSGFVASCGSFLAVRADGSLDGSSNTSSRSELHLVLHEDAVPILDPSLKRIPQAM